MKLAIITVNGPMGDLDIPESMHRFPDKCHALCERAYEWGFCEGVAVPVKHTGATDGGPIQRHRANIISIASQVVLAYDDNEFQIQATGFAEMLDRFGHEATFAAYKVNDVTAEELLMYTRQISKRCVNVYKSVGEAYPLRPAFPDMLVGSENPTMDNPSKLKAYLAWRTSVNLTGDEEFSEDVKLFENSTLEAMRRRDVYSSTTHLGGGESFLSFLHRNRFSPQTLYMAMGDPFELQRVQPQHRETRSNRIYNVCHLPTSVAEFEFENYLYEQDTTAE